MTIKEKLSAGINGFGRFGLHLLKYWLDRREDSAFSINMINDDTLSIEDAYRIITSDDAVNFRRYKVKAVGDELLISTPFGNNSRIHYTNEGKGSLESIPWIGKPDMVFECSGKHAEFPLECRRTYLAGNTKHVVISSTCWDADKTIVFGFNHLEFNPSEDSMISYGSCTVNAFVPLANWMHKTYVLLDSDVHVAHNRPKYTLENPKNRVLFRKACTLERVGPNLLDFLKPDNFIVDYAVGPFTNISAITFRFGVKDPIERYKFTHDLRRAVGEGGELQGLYYLDAVDVGDSNRYHCTIFSAVFPENGIKTRGSNLYLLGYFDNENSANRFYDLVNYMASHEVLKK